MEYHTTPLGYSPFRTHSALRTARTHRTTVTPLAHPPSCTLHAPTRIVAFLCFFVAYLCDHASLALVSSTLNHTYYVTRSNEFSRICCLCAVCAFPTHGRLRIDHRNPLALSLFRLAQKQAKVNQPTQHTTKKQHTTMNAFNTHCLHTIGRGIYRTAHLLGLPLPTGFKRRELLGISGDAKTVKGESFGFLTGILYLSPLDLGGFGNLCPFASPGCSADCLNSAGRGAFNSVQKARREKTALFFKANQSFLCNLALDIHALQLKATKLGLRPVVRLNGTSDIAWEKLRVNGLNLMELFPRVAFYDYTKNPKRALDNAKGLHPKNYRLVFSRSETNEADCKRVLEARGNVAVVFRKQLPKRYLGKRVIVGDESDLRFLDPRGCVVGLTAKGKAKQSNSGFVVNA